MKRLGCFLLSLMLFTSCCSAAFAAVEDTFTLSPDEVRRIDALAGSDSTWREGMSYSAAMSAWQKYCWLTDFLSHELATAENRCTSLFRKKDSLPADAAAEVTEARKTVLQRKQQAQYWVFELNSEIQAVSQSKTTLSAADTSQAERVAAYRRMRQAGDRLNTLNREMAEATPGTWSRETEVLSDRLSAFSAAAQPIVMAKATSPEDAADTADFRILILDADQIGFEIHAADLTQLSGARVTLSSEGVTRTAATDASGVALFDADAFNTDSYNRLWAEIRVEKDGYRTWESKATRVVGGEGIRILLEEDNGDSYVQYITFRGMDLLHESETVWSTPANDAVQTFEVGIHTKAGRPGTFSIDYTDASTGKPATAAVQADGVRETVQVFDLSNRWCAMLQADQPVTVRYAAAANSETENLCRTDAIKVEKAVVQSPIKSVTPGQQIMTGTAFNINFPTGLPVMKQFSLGFNFPEQILDAVPVNVSVTPNGNVALGIGIGAVKELTDAANSSWKLDNGIKTRETWDDLKRNRTSLTQIAEKSTQARGQRSSNLDLFHVRFNVYFMAMLTGNVKADKSPDAASAYLGSLDLFLSVGFNATVAFREYYTVGPVPCTVGFDFTAGLQFGVTVPFTFRTDSAKLLDFVNWRDFGFDRDALDITVTLRAMINVYGGVGIKGIVALYIRGYFGTALTLHIRPYQENKLSLDGYISAGVQLVAELFFVSFKADILSWNTPVPIPSKVSSSLRSAGGSPGAASGEDAVQYVTASTKTLGDVDGSTVKTVQSGNDFYCFYMTEALVSGRKRPWLRAYKISPDKSGDAVLTDLPLADLGMKVYDGSIPADAEVVDFSVATLNDAVQQEGGAELIAVQVIFQETEPDREILERFGFELYHTDEELYYIYSAAGETKQCFSRKFSSVSSRNTRASVSGASVTLAAAPSETVDGWQKYYTTTSFATSDDPTEFSCRSHPVYIRSDRDFDFSASAGATEYRSVSRSDYRSILQTAFVKKGERLLESYMLCERRDNGQLDFLATFQKDYGDTETVTLSGDYTSFRYMPDTAENSLIALVGNPDETGRCSLYLCNAATPAPEKQGSLSEPRDMGICVSPAGYEFVNLGKSRALYYLNQSLSENPRYEIIAVYLAPAADGSLFATAPFHLAVFRPEDLNVRKGVTGFSLYSDNAGFLQGFVYEKASDSTQGNSARYFSFRQTLQIEIRDIITENVLVRPGETVNLLFSVLNSGNTPLNKAVLSAYGVREGSSARIPLADLTVNFEHPEESVERQYDEEGNLLSLTRGLLAASCYDRPSDDAPDTFITGLTGHKAEVYATTVLMPDETHLYRTQFIVPDSFSAGDYRIYVAPSKLVTAVNPSGGRYQAVSAWTGSLTNPDSGKTADLASPVYVSATVRTSPVTAGSTSGTEETLPVVLRLEGADEKPLLLASGTRPLSGFASRTLADARELDLDFADLSVTATLSCQAGQTLVHAVLRNLSSSPVRDPSLTVLADGIETYRTVLRGVTLGAYETVSLDLPLDRLTGGNPTDELTLTVDSTGSESCPDNNTVTLEPDQLLKILRQPEDVTLGIGGDAEFSVTAGGGKAPYTYRWQKSKDGRKGTFTDISGATTAVLKLCGIGGDDNATYYRCIVKDAEGATVISSAALLLVSGKPPLTGDATPLGLYFLLTAVAVTVFVLLCGKHSRNQQ